MFVLMLVAIYGLIGEMTTPGAILPGVIGAIALVLALYMSAILPVNVAGLLLIGLAVALFVIDVFAPTHGVLTGGGIVAFLVGSLMLFDRRDPLFHLSLSYIIPSVIRDRRVFSPDCRQRTPGTASAGKSRQRDDDRKDRPCLDADRFNARKGFRRRRILDRDGATTPINEGETVQIIAVEGLTVKVIPKT